MDSQPKYFKVIYERGFANEINESLDLGIQYKNKDELLNIFKLIGLSPNTFNVIPAQPEPGKSYTYVEHRQFPKLIDGLLIENPGHCQIFGVDVYISCANGVIKICASPGSYNIEDQHLKNAKHIENNIMKFNFKYIELNDNM